MPRNSSGGRSGRKEEDAPGSDEPDVFIVKRIVDSDDALTTFMINWAKYDHVMSK